MILLRLTGLNYYHLVLVVNVWLGEQCEISCLMWLFRHSYFNPNYETLIVNDSQQHKKFFLVHSIRIHICVQKSANPPPSFIFALSHTEIIVNVVLYCSSIYKEAPDTRQIN